MPRNTPHPVSSFGPELLDLLLTGARSRVEVPGPYYVVSALRARLHTLRSKLRAENHTMYPLTTRAKVSIVFVDPNTPIRRASRGDRVPLDRGAPSVLIVEPKDTEFTALIRNSGVTLDSGASLLRGAEDGTPSGDSPGRPRPLEDEPADSFVARLMSGGDVEKKP